ncbi:MAG: methyltransferase domain-containing protein [Chthoniobacterales bacterium]|nr:methyltransferase domain-containing protein [Chthoniobacterales bacterium]
MLNEDTFGNRCRFCGEPLRETFVDLGLSPLCESYVAPSQLNAPESFYPLHSFVCEKCFLVQLPEHVAASEIFEEYAYFSSYSDSWLAHAESYVEAVAARFELSNQSLVLEVASNDGYLLQYFKAKGIPVLGIEPAKNVARVAVEKGIPSVTAFFGSRLARELASDGKMADLLLGNNVLAHVPDINDFVSGLKILLKPEGAITMEFPHLIRLVEENQFDTIYHEHFSYLSFSVVERIFAAHRLALFDVEELSTHGGSLRIYACHAEDKTKSILPNVAALKAREVAWGINQLQPYRMFAQRVEATKRGILRFLIEAREEKKSIAGYGAPGKGNTLLNYCGIRTDLLEYTVDRNPYKHGKFTPGMRIPIYPPERIRETQPDYLFILPWNLKDEIMAQNAFIREWGGKFVVPIPQITVF